MELQSFLATAQNWNRLGFVLFKNLFKTWYLVGQALWGIPCRTYHKWIIVMRCYKWSNMNYKEVNHQKKIIILGGIHTDKNDSSSDLTIRCRRSSHFKNPSLGGTYTLGSRRPIRSRSVLPALVGHTHRILADESAAETHGAISRIVGGTYTQSV